MSGPALILALSLLALAPSAPAISEARAAIEQSTNRALAALRAGDRAGYLAVLAPDFRAIDAKGRTTRGPASPGKPARLGFATLQWNQTDRGGTTKMRLAEAASTLRTIKMPGVGEAVVTGEEILVWTGPHGPDLVSPGGAVTPNTERRTVTVTYRRHWVKTGKGWRLKSSRTLSERMAAVL
jgi:hypothetical protein